MNFRHSAPVVSSQLQSKGRMPVIQTSLSALILALLSLLSCQKRQFNSDSSEQTVYGFGEPRIAFANAGIGWCYYLEDAAVPVERHPTQDVIVDVSYDIDTQIERRDTYQKVLTVRKFKRAHDVAFDFDVFSRWSTPLFSTSRISPDEFTAITTVEGELAHVRSDLDQRGFMKSRCERQLAEDAEALKAGKPLSVEASTLALRLRCQSGPDDVARQSEMKQLTQAGYKFVRRALHELTTEKRWDPFRRTGVRCRSEITQLESSRGQFLGSVSKKSGSPSGSLK